MIPAYNDYLKENLCDKCKVYLENPKKDFPFCEECDKMLSEY